MDRNLDVDLFLWLEQEINLALPATSFAKNENDFGYHLDELAPSLDLRRRIENKTLEELAYYAAEYFDAFAHGFPDLRHMTWTDARKHLDDLRIQTRRELGLPA